MLEEKRARLEIKKEGIKREREREREKLKTSARNEQPSRFLHLRESAFFSENNVQRRHASRK